MGGDNKAAEDGDVKNEKAPLAAADDTDETGDPIHPKVQAIVTLNGLLATVFLAQGFTSSAWVYAVDYCYWQGLFVYCVQKGFSESTEVESVSQSSSSEEEDHFDDGCERIDLDNQSYTMGSALLTGVSLSTTLFGTLLLFLGLWVRDLESKRKTFKIGLYLFVISFITNIISMINYATGFDDILEEQHPLGPFTKPDDEYHFGWSFDVCGYAIACHILVLLGVVYALLTMPVYVEIEDEEK